MRVKWGSTFTMNRIDKFLVECDARLDLLTTRISQKIDTNFFYVSLSFFLMLAVLTVGRELYQKPRFEAGVISTDVQKIADVLGEINEHCLIKSFSLSRIKLNFLTLRQVAGDEIGGLVLAQPENWQGPYLEVTPRIQGKEYELVQAADGLFVVPGDAVRLPNKLRMGTHIKLSSNSNVAAMLKKGGKLFFEGRALGARVGNAPVFMTAEDEQKKPHQVIDNQKYQEIIDVLKEVASALPFALAAPAKKDIKF